MGKKEKTKKKKSWKNHCQEEVNLEGENSYSHTSTSSTN